MGVRHVNDLTNLIFQFLGVLGLLIELLSLKKLVEGGYDVSVDLSQVRCCSVVEFKKDLRDRSKVCMLL